MIPSGSTDSNKILSYFIDYVVSKALDYVATRVHSKHSEKSVEQHAYEVLKKSLFDFCDRYGWEKNESAFEETLCLGKCDIAQIGDYSFLRNALEKAVAATLTYEQWQEWVQIVFEHIVSDEHQKLYRAITFSRMCKHKENVAEPEWIRLALDGNSFEIVTLEYDLLNILYDTIKTALSNSCWRNTLCLLDELIRNATKHGSAQQVSLIIEESALTLIDDGFAFDTEKLVTMTTGCGGGRKTLIEYNECYPEVLVQYCYQNAKNKTSICFPEKVFNVNGLCELHIDSKKKEYVKEYVVVPCFTQGNARYYYADFGKNEWRFFSWSLAGDFVGAFVDFTRKVNSSIFIGIPSKENEYFQDDNIWDDMAEKLQSKLSECKSDRIQICRY